MYRYLLDNYEDQGSLKKLWGYLATNVVFIQISTDVSSALKIFETINERGVGLNPMDLLKNLLFTQVAHSDFTKLKNEWKKIATGCAHWCSDCSLATKATLFGAGGESLGGKQDCVAPFGDDGTCMFVQTR